MGPKSLPPSLLRVLEPLMDGSASRFRANSTTDADFANINSAKELMFAYTHVFPLLTVYDRVSLNHGDSLCS